MCKITRAPLFPQRVARRFANPAMAGHRCDIEKQNPKSGCGALYRFCPRSRKIHEHSNATKQGTIAVPVVVVERWYDLIVLQLPILKLLHNGIHRRMEMSRRLMLLTAVRSKYGGHVSKRKATNGKQVTTTAQISISAVAVQFATLDGPSIMFVA